MRLFLSFLFLFGYFDAFSTNYFVNVKTGSKKFDGRSYATPKKYIQEAADMTRPGDTVFVAGGIYTNSCPSCDVLEITRSGKNKRYIVYTNIAGQHPVISFNGWAGVTVKNGASYIKFNGFEIIGDNARVTLAKALKQPGGCANKKGKPDPKYNGNAIIIAGGKKHSHHICITNNLVHDCGGGGIGAINADYITVEENTVYNTSWYTLFGTSGISFYQFWNYDNQKGYHNYISRNKCYNNKSLVPWMKSCEISDGNGIIIDDFRNRQNGSKLGNYTGRTLIENNISWCNGGTGIHTFQSDHIDIINNTAYLNCTKGINAGQILSGLSDDNKIVNNIMVADSLIFINSNYNNTNLTYQNNLHYNITYPDKARISITGANCINANPLFVLAGNSIKANFRLGGKSPAIGAGNATIFSKTDFDGKKRAIPNAPDIGAYER
ncbi:choice-of-anchor Q domain-containing protein [Mucilaginibacter sp. AW1-3]